MTFRSLLKYSILAQFMLVGCNRGSQQDSISQPADTATVISSTVTDSVAKIGFLKISKISVFDKKGKLQFTDEFRYNQQGLLESTNSGATAINYGSLNNEKFISVKTNGCTYTYRYSAEGKLYLMNQAGPDWKLDLDIELTDGKLKSIKAQEAGFAESATWQDGNLLSYLQYDEEESSVLNFKYGNIDNQFGFDLIGYLACAENRTPYMNVRFLAPEAVSKKLPVLITSRQECAGEMPVADKFTLNYILDSKGRVKTINVVGRKKYEITYID